MTVRVKLTDAKIRNLPAAPKGKRVEVWDEEVRGLLVRVTDKGSKSLLFCSRFPGSKHPVRRIIDVYPRILLGPARDVAREWAAMLREGLDPREETRKRERKTAVETAATFSKLLGDWETRHAVHLRRGREMVRLVRHDIEPLFGDRPVASLERADIIDAIRRP